MSLLDALWHLLNFALPAVGLGGLSALGAKLVWRRELAAVSLRRLARDASLASLVALAAGLFVFQRDGRMLTYFAMTGVCAFTLWWRGWGPGRR